MGPIKNIKLHIVTDIKDKMWDNPMKLDDVQTVQNKSSDIPSDHNDESLKYIRWIVAGITVGILIIITIGVTIYKFSEMRRKGKERERGLGLLDDQTNLEY